MADSIAVFGYVLDKAEWDISIEIVKATLLIFVAAISVLIFDIRSKKREIDSILFNDLIKGRIEKMHSSNKSTVDLVSELTEYLEKLSVDAKGRLSLWDEGRIRDDRIALASIQEFRNSLTSRCHRLKSELRGWRYELGERGYESSLGRLTYLQDRVEHVWGFYYQDCIDRWNLELKRKSGIFEDVNDDRIQLHIAEIIAFVFLKELRGIFLYIQDDFESVIKGKGKGSKYTRPVNLDRDTGMIRYNFLHQETRYQLSLLMTRLERSRAGNRTDSVIR